MHTSAFIKQLHSIGGNGQTIADMDITSHDAVDMASKFGTFILVDGVSSAGVGSMDTNLVLMNIKSTLVSTFLQFGSKLFYKSSVSSEIQKRSFMRSPQPIPTTCRTSKQSSSWHGCSPPPLSFTHTYAHFFPAKPCPPPLCTDTSFLYTPQ